MKRHLVTVAHSAMLILIALSVLLARERMLHADNAYATFLIVNDKQFIFAHGRYPLFLTQFIPVLLARFGASLSLLIIAYSANFYLLYYACFLCCAYFYKNITASLAVVLTLLVTTSEIFFLQTEVLHGLVCCCVVYAALSARVADYTRTRLAVHYLLFAASVYCGIFFHPLSSLLLLFVIALHAVEQQQWYSKKHLILAGVVIAGIVLKSIQVGEQSYEAGFYAQAGTLKETLRDYFSIYTITFFKKRIGGLYLLGIIMGSCSLIYLLTRKKWKLVLYFMVSIVAYFIAIPVIFKGDSNIMMERVFLGWGMIVSFLFMTACVLFIGDAQKGFRPVFAISMCVVIMCCGFVKIYEATPAYQQRLALLKEEATIAQQQAGNKFYSYTADTKMNLTYVLWGTAVEHLLVSALYFPEQVKTVYRFNNEEEAMQIMKNAKMNEHSLMVVPFSAVLTDSILDKKYFNLKPGYYNYIKFKS